MGIFFYFGADEDLGFVKLDESRTYDLQKGYRMRYDPGHGPGMQDHIHVYAKNRQLFAINRDGSAHDGFHGVKIPNHVRRRAAELFPSFSWPEDNIIEGTRPGILSFREFVQSRETQSEFAEMILEAEAAIGHPG